MFEAFDEDARASLAPVLAEIPLKERREVSRLLTKLAASLATSKRRASDRIITR
jgi:hypothetical protein